MDAVRVRGHSGLCSDQSKGLGMMLVHSVLVFLVATIGFFYKKLAPRLAKYYFLRSSIFAGRWKFLAVSDVMLFVPSWDPPEEDLRTLHVGDKTFSVTKGLHIDCQKTGGWVRSQRRPHTAHMGPDAIHHHVRRGGGRQRKTLWLRVLEAASVGRRNCGGVLAQREAGGTIQESRVIHWSWLPLR